MSDQIIDGKFTGSSDAAIAMLGKMENEAQVDAPVVTTEAKIETSAEIPATQTETITPQTVESILDVSPETKVRIKVDGVEKVVSAKDYTELLQRNDVITQRHQALAKQRQELEGHYAQKEAYLTQQAQAIQLAYQQLQQQGDPVQRLAQALQTQNQPVQSNPNEIATIGEVQAELQRFQQAQQQELLRLYHQTQQERAQEKQTTLEELALKEDQKRVTQTVSSFMQTEDGKMLSEINPQAEAVIRWNALQMGPQNVEQAVEYINQYANDWASKVKGRFAHQKTADAVKAAKTTMEAPSGSSPTLVKPPVKASLKKDGSIDWDSLRERSVAILNSMDR